MLTELGKALRRIRLDRNQLLKDMAKILGVTPAYLSAIENGKRKPTKDLLNNIHHRYELSSNEINNLNEAYSKTISEITIDMAGVSASQSDLGLIFARKIDSLSEEQISEIKRLLLKGDTTE